MFVLTIWLENQLIKISITLLNYKITSYEKEQKPDKIPAFVFKTYDHEKDSCAIEMAYNHKSV